jgi:DNA polymerase V
MKTVPFFAKCPIYIPLFGYRVRAGFPSPAEDYQQKPLDLAEHLIRHPAASYFAIAEGDSMSDYGIFNGDLLIVDRALEPEHNDVIIAAVNGELTCKKLDRHRHLLISGHQSFPPIPITEDMDMICEGVVTASVRYHRCSR